MDYARRLAIYAAQRKGYQLTMKPKDLKETGGVTGGEDGWKMERMKDVQPEQALPVRNWWVFGWSNIFLSICLVFNKALSFGTFCLAKGGLQAPSGLSQATFKILESHVVMLRTTPNKMLEWAM